MCDEAMNILGADIFRHEPLSYAHVWGTLNHKAHGCTESTLNIPTCTGLSTAKKLREYYRLLTWHNDERPAQYVVHCRGTGHELAMLGRAERCSGLACSFSIYHAESAALSGDIESQIPA